ncbi:glycosyltransferase [Streptococcus ovuberis]|uniref:Glycosyltransferase n=1 Tax=Streptococcus ovuberis TaxID=1936207 RepID=A0A7X6RZQ3_9STRE|nr:glycosyltransferase [Streptococcus ovuberis]NKZ19383.1 glycosyltransferase [Streptococcus ovuberis]
MVLKILHITATLGGGIPIALSGLVEAQNRIENMESRVIFVGDKADNKKISFGFEWQQNSEVSLYLKNYSPNVVIFHGFYFTVYLKLFKQVMKTGIPYFIEPHGSFGHEAMRKSYLKKKLANKLLFDKFVRFAKGIIFLNEFEKTDSIYRTNVDVVIPNGQHSVSKTISTTAEIVPEKVKFYFCGRFDFRQKGLDVLFDALSIIDKKPEASDIVFDIYGYGSKSEEQLLNSKLATYKNISVINHGKISPVEYEKQLPGKIMVLPSRYEGFPMTILEAWSLGNPCLVTSGTNMLDEVIKNKLGWGCELTAENIANTMINAAIEYRNNDREYIQKCQEYVIKEYSWKNVAEISFRVLREFSSEKMSY